MMKAAQVGKAGGDFELVERDIPEPGPGQVRVKVEACGICHSDVMVKDGLWPGLQYPRVPGHQVAGRVDALGEGVSAVRKGDRVERVPATRKPRRSRRNDRPGHGPYLCERTGPG
jgi:D-arabinose 1-dehydrogenase-like Zn-dependent alcohol dehydrogenase